MKAIVQDVYGSVEVLELRDVDAPVPGDDDVLIRVRAAGVDQGVWHLMTGLPYLTRVVGYGLRKPKTRIRGRAVAGRVEAGLAVAPARRGASPRTVNSSAGSVRISAVPPNCDRT